MRFFIFLALSVATLASRAENQFSSWRKFTSAEFLAEEDAVSPGQKVALGFNVHLEKDWHSYWINPGDSGAPIKLSLTGKVGNKKLDLLTGPIQFPIPERMDTGPIVSFVYNTEVLYLADVVIPDSLPLGSRLDLHLDAEWLVCSEVCIPALQGFDLSLPVKNVNEVRPSADAEKFLAGRGHQPRSMNSKITEKRDDKRAELSFSIPSDFARMKFKDFLPLRGSHLANGKPALISQSAKDLKITQPIRVVGERRRDLVGLLVLSDGQKTVGLQWGDPSYGFLNRENSEKKTATAESLSSLLWILFSAFLGGLILNLMPCVFPILSIKLFSLVKQSGVEARKIRIQNFSYTLGVLVSFLLIGLSLSALRNAGSMVGWGFQLQSPYFVLLISWLFFLLALQLFGLYEINWIDGNIGGRLANQGGNAGAFFTGVLAVIVASPCTAPFMGAALGFAIAQSTGVLLAVFLSMGLGLAFPYLLFGLFPSWARVLPRPGAWMITFKKIMAIPLLLTCAWMVWLLAQLKGDVAMAVALAGMAIGFLLLWIKSKRQVSSIMIGGLTVTIGLMIMYHLPNATAKNPTAGSGLNWEVFEPSQAIWNGGPPIFIDFTADWCLTCKVNEKLVFDRDEIAQFLKSNHVRLLQGDWTRQDPEITQFLSRYGRIGVPFYVAFGPGAPEGKILPEVLTSETFKEEMQSVIQTKEGSK